MNARIPYFGITKQINKTHMKEDLPTGVWFKWVHDNLVGAAHILDTTFNTWSVEPAWSFGVHL